MSRIGKKPIPIPEGIKVEIKNGEIVCEGEKGVLKKTLPPEIDVKKEGGNLLVLPRFKSKKGKEFKKIKALWGLWRTLIANMIEGVRNGFEKKLEIVGVGYSAQVADKNLILKVGFAHPVEIEIPSDLKVSVEKNIISIFGIDKEKVGNFAAKIRSVKEPDPYKGKGIRYLGEEIKLKPGKKAALGK